jgi:anaphase-promoting complex subunit 8
MYIQSSNGFQNESSLCITPLSSKTKDQMHEILQGLEDIHDKDPFLLYLYGVVCIELKMLPEGKKALIESIRAYPYNWSCWLALSEYCDKPITVLDLASQLSSSFISNCWKIQVLNDLHSSADMIHPILDQTAKICFHSKHLAIQRAILFHNSRDFEEAEILFEELHRNDPYLIEGMDLFSNVLYVRRNYSKLCDLAHAMSMIDRFRAETCVCIGNYYSLKGDRKKAIESFSRAVQLDHNYSPAWTLLGHEHVDSCNPKGAVEVYRKAIGLLNV